MHSLVVEIVRSINWLTWGEITAGLITLATSFRPRSPGFTGMAAPTRESHLSTRLLSYRIFGYAVVIWDR